MMMKYLLWITLCFFCINCHAQRSADPKPFAKKITITDLKRQLNIIASAEMEGRNTPSPGLEKAATYIESQFKTFGLTPGNNGSYRQPFLLEKDSANVLSLNMGGMEFESWTDFAPWIQMPSKADLNFTNYIFVGYGIVDENRDDYKSTDVRGKLVVLLSGQPDGYSTNKSRRQSPAFTGNKILTAQKKGAAAVLVIAETLPSKQMMSGMYRPKSASASKEEATAIPVFYINDNIVSKSGQNIGELKSMVGSNSVDPITRSIDVHIGYTSGKQTATVNNVIGYVEGTDKKNEYLIITAHYDHLGKDANGSIFYGADDDGSGTVSVIEMAKAFADAKRAGKGPRRTVVFMTVCGEEKGLWGSEYYSDHPIFPLDKTTANLNIDMIGRIDTERKMPDTLNYVYVIGHDKLSTDLVKINEGMNNKYTKLVLDYKFDDPNDPNHIYYRSDHYNFAKKGVPILFFYDGMLQADYHKITDTVDKINFPLLAKRAQMVFYTGWEMANREDMLKRDLELTQ